jgi:hypothetical protein
MKRRPRAKRNWILVGVLSVGLSVNLNSQQPSGASTKNIEKWEKLVSDNNGELPSGIQGNIGSYIGIDAPWTEAQQCEATDECPDIFLFDRKLSPHPNLDFESLNQHDSTSSPKADDALTIRNDFNDADHGMGMAGIISAHVSTRGLIGVTPRSRQVFFVDWEAYKQTGPGYTDLARILTDLFLHSPNHPHVMVFATSWKSHPKSSLYSCGQRFPQEDLLENLLADPSLLVIVAAGNDEKLRTDDIVRSSVKAPQDMGDCPNVVVVTACFECSSATPAAPQIPYWANYSTEGLVHIAAYGDHVLTTALNNRLAVMGEGTSAAAAFVAGVASSMLAKWPRTYKDNSFRVKFRLQVTATPSLSGLDARKVNSGILNPVLATKDPTVDYLLDKYHTDIDMKDAGWCVDQIKISKDGGFTKENIDAETIYRIYCSGSGLDHCTVFHADYEQTRAGLVLRSGPGQLDGYALRGVNFPTADPTKVAIFRANGKQFHFGEFADLLLHQPMSRLETCEPSAP